MDYLGKFKKGYVIKRDLEDNIELNDVGYLMALTANPDINKFAINKFQTQFGENGSFRLVTAEEMNDPNNNPEEGLFSHTDDYNTLVEVAKKYPSIHEIELNDISHYEGLIEVTNNDKEIIPLFLKDNNNELYIISSYNKAVKKIAKGWQLVYLGKPIGIEKL